jgi:hypothetical protein
MDAIDNLIYSTLNVCFYPNLFTSEKIRSDFDQVGISEPPVTIPVVGGGTIQLGGNLPALFNSQTSITSYQEVTRRKFVALDDTQIIADAIRKHWFDMTNRVSYTNNAFVGGQADSSGLNFPLFNPQVAASLPPNGAFVKFNIPPYHLIFSYLVENTRIAQIFERMISQYVHDEKLTKTNSREAFQWITNTEGLFYTNSKVQDRRGLNSQLRPVSESIRRNAYQRMFGMDLAFGDVNNNAFSYTKAEFANSSFITLFENFLIEVWRGFINANNTSGQNTTDTENLEDIARRLQEMMMSRRTTELDFTNYRYFNLSLEEYSSYMFMYWLFYVVSFDSPVVDYLNCTANTPGERLINIGRKVGLPAHTKSVALLDIAQPMNLVLRSMELGLFNDANFLQRVLRSLSTINPVTNPAPTPQEISILNNLLLIVNNWEKATGHRIKNPEANITGSVRIQQPQTNGKMALAPAN